ncbi:nucleotidyltransferase family protein [Streptomyces sp. NBC_00576]|nr:nucleotidyltransferase family protein [Streptomyces sp. NBC_00576]WUB72331.1 nucleotidyltransferase family protein [Streptomyces sp. NBC_00576]
MIGRLALDEQLGALREVLSRNDVLVEVLARTATLDLPGWYLTAGCLFQTVWNVVTDRPPTDGTAGVDLLGW